MAGKPLAPLGALTQEKLRQILDYNAETGVFRWTGSRRPHMAGMIAGTLNGEGYRRIQVDSLLYQGSHLAWLYVTGTWPAGQLDHKNKNTSDDRFENLRDATQTENKANSGAYRNNLLGVKGVRLHRNGQYEARLRVNGQLQYLGCYRTLDEAKAVYDRAAEATFGEFARSA